MRRAAPILSGLAFFLAYAGWVVLRPESSPAAGWGVVAYSVADRIRAFLVGDAFWMGASYAVPAGITVFALLIFGENRKRAAAGAAGGIAMAGAIYGLGCFVLGCCGSPMMAIYVGLLGAKWTKVSGPLTFGVTLASVAVGVWLLRRRAGCNCEGACKGSGSG